MKWLYFLLILLIPYFISGESSHVDYDNIDYLYKINLPEIIVFPEPDQDDVILLAKLLNGECPHEPFLGQVAVINTVQHRMRRKKQSMKSIVYQKGQYDGVRTSRFRANPKSELIEVARAALIGYPEVVPYGVQFFANEKIATDTKWINSKQKDKYLTIGNHTFYWIKKLKP